MLLNRKNSIIIYVEASLSTCIERIGSKNFSETPYPLFDEALPDTITRCHDEFEQGDLDALWKSSVLWIFSVDGESMATDRLVGDLPFAQLCALSAVNSAINSLEQTKALIWYGSGPRGELGPDSDIDLFLWTDQSVVEIEDSLRIDVPGIQFTDILKSKLIVRYFPDVLVEITCSDDLSNLDHFYSHSRITDRSQSILIGDETVRNHIDQVAYAWGNSSGDVQYFLAESILLLLFSWTIGQKRRSLQVLFSCQHPSAQHCTTEGRWMQEEGKQTTYQLMPWASWIQRRLNSFSTT